MRTSLDRGKTWSPLRTITARDTFGWAELDSRGKTVVATVQTTNGGLVVARSGKNGRNWRESLLKPPQDHIFSAADVTLMSGGRAWLSYVKERIRGHKLVSTRLITRKSSSDGASYGKPRPVTKDARLLRMAPNLSVSDGRVTLVVQSGQFDRSPRHIYVSRLR